MCVCVKVCVCLFVRVSVCVNIRACLCHIVCMFSCILQTRRTESSKVTLAVPSWFCAIHFMADPAHFNCAKTDTAARRGAVCEHGHSASICAKESPYLWIGGCWPCTFRGGGRAWGGRLAKPGREALPKYAPAAPASLSVACHAFSRGSRHDAAPTDYHTHTWRKYEQRITVMSWCW